MFFLFYLLLLNDFIRFINRITHFSFYIKYRQSLGFHFVAVLTGRTDVEAKTAAVTVRSRYGSCLSYLLMVPYCALA